MRHLFVIDPLGDLDPCHDSSVAMMEAAEARDHEVWVTGIDGLGIRDGRSIARVTRVTLDPVQRAGDRWVANPAWWRHRGDECTEPLDAFDFVWMRVDPPVGRDYLRATYLLERVSPQGCTVINRPSGLRDANEKLFALRYPDLIPETLVTSSLPDVRAFVEGRGLAVLKPLDAMGGRGVHLLRADDPNLATIVDTATEGGVVQVMVQEHLPAVAEGDRRVIVIGGEPAGAVRRISGATDFRCNMAVGASVEKDVVTTADRAICRRIRQDLLAEGLWFVGLDVIGDKVTEVNVTSPTGIREIDLLSHGDVAGDLLDWAARTFG